MQIHYPYVAPCLLILALANTFYLRKQWIVINQANQHPPEHSYLGHDFPEYLPLSVNELPVFPFLDEETVHYPLLGNMSDDEWFSLAPEEAGYTRLGKDGRLFMVTMFHELHCLRVLNLAFSKERVATPGHIQHCLNYIRQSVLCSPDLSLEPGDFERRDFEVERTGALHTCKDWDAVYQTMHETKVMWQAENKVHK